MILKIVSVFLMIVFSTSILFGCSCFYEPMSIKKIDHYETVFLGTIVNKETIGNILSSNKNAYQDDLLSSYFKYTFKIEENIKVNQASNNTIIIYSSTQGSTCGVDYGVGDKIYIFAYKVNEFQITGLCANNKRYLNANKNFKRIVKQYLKPRNRKTWKDENCDLTAKGKFDKGLMDGNWIFYYPDGNIESEGRFKNGLREGDWLKYQSKLSSHEYFMMLNDSQKAKVKRHDNILYQKESFINGKKVKTENLFILGG